MPMLAADMASTTAKPSMTLPRNRNVGSLAAIHCGQPRFDNPTSNPVLLAGNRHNRERELPDPVLKIRAEWIRAGKFAPNRHPDTWCVFQAIHVFSSCWGSRRGCRDQPGHDESRNRPPNSWAASAPARKREGHGVASGVRRDED